MKSALLVVDAQKLYTDPDSEMYCADAKLTLTRINKVIEWFESQGLPIFLIRHVHKADGSDLGRLFDFSGEAQEEFNFVEGSPEVEYSDGLLLPGRQHELVKNRYSAFAGTTLHKDLQKLKVARVAICGFMTNFCCESTARSAHDRDYFVDFVLDATGTPGTDHLDEKEIRKAVGELLGAGFARVLKTKEYVAMAHSR